MSFPYIYQPMFFVCGDINRCASINPHARSNSANKCHDFFSNVDGAFVNLLMLLMSFFVVIFWVS
jgi:hypothetical protein